MPQYRSWQMQNKIKLGTKIAGRYMGQENAASYGNRNAVKGECLIRIRPTKIIAMKDMVE